MKQITEYIIEKANFLVKKHLKSARSVTSYNDLRDKDYFAIEYVTNNVPYTHLGVFKEYIFKSEKDSHVVEYIGFDNSKPHLDRHVQVSNILPCEKNDVVRLANIKETELINSILDEYDFFTNTTNKIIGTVKNNKFTLKE